MKLNHLFYIIFITFYLVVAISCDPIEEKITTENAARLTYSSDTIIFDTLFSTVGSITKRLRIYNTNEKAISLDKIALGKGSNSSYKIIVNGEEASSFADEVIFGNDSLLVLVEVFINPQDENLPFLVKDSLVIASNGNSEFVRLVAWGQDAVFIDNEIIDCNTTWTADRPYVIYNAALIDTLCRLDVEAGTRIYMGNDASLIVAGSLHINGTLDDKVIIRNTRLDAKYENAVGQWSGIYFLNGSQNNEIQFADIKNGNRIGSPNPEHSFDLTISNTTIHHMSFGGIIAFNSSITAQNLLIYNCGLFTVGNFMGGSYQYQHCTFTNGQNQLSGNDPSVAFTDFFRSDNEVLFTNDLSVILQNSIFWGNQKEEFIISESGETNVSVSMNNNLLRTENEDYNINNNIISQDRDAPGFINKYLFNYQIDSLSSIRDKGINLGITHDIIGTLRDNLPDIGAYERKDSIP